jgi:hypothetical protein
MNLDRDPCTIVPNTNIALLPIHFNINLVHLVIPLVVITGIDQNLIENLVKPRDIVDPPKLKLVGIVDNPQTSVLHFETANIGIWALQDML